LSSPIDFGISFGGLDGAIAQWRSYQTGLESVINTSAELGTAQQNLGRTMQQSQQSFDSLDSTIQELTGTMQSQQQQIQQLMQAEQQQISILEGAGTSADAAAQGVEAYTGSLSHLGQELDSGSRSLDEYNTLQENLAGNTQTTFEKIQQLGAGFGQAAGAITGLIFSAHSLNRAQFLLHRTETSLEAARNKLADQTEKLGKLTQKYGGDSEQVAAVLADISIQTQKVTDIEERAELVQESYNHTLLSFATTTGPLIISTVSSISQGIQSMGGVLNISRQSAINFIGAWGPWIAAGGAVVAIGLDVVRVMQQIEQAETERRQAMASGDPFGQLNAELKELQTFNTDPLFKIGEAMLNIFGGPEGQKAMKEFHLELDLRQWQSDLSNQIDDFVTSPDFKAAFESLPPSIQKTLQSELDTIVGIPFNPVNYLNPETGVVDPYRLAKSKELLDEHLNNLAKHVEEKQEEIRRITISGSAEERAGIMGLPSDAQWKEATTVYKGNLQSVLVLLKDFNTKRLADARLTWDQYISQTDVPEWFATLAKGIGNVDAAFQGTGIQGSQQFFETLKGGLQEVTDAENDMLPKSQEQIDILNQMGQSADMTGVSLTGMAGKYDEVKEAVNNFLQEHEKQIQIDKLINDQMRAQVETWAGPLPEGMKFTTDTLLKANDTFKETGNVTEGLNVLLAENKSQFDALRKSLGDIDQQTQDVINSTDLLTGSQEKAKEAIGGWFDGITKSMELERQQTDLLTQMAIGYGIDLPAGIKLTNDQLMSLIEAYRRTGTAAGAMADIHAEVFSDLHSQMDEVIGAFSEGGDKMKDTWKDIKDSIPKGQRGFMEDFFGDLGDLDRANQELQDSAAALDLLLDITNGRLDEGQMEDWSSKFVKQLDELNREADDLPFTNNNLDDLIEKGKELAAAADTPEEFRELIMFLHDLGGAIDSQDSDKIDALAEKYLNLNNAISAIVTTIKDNSAEIEQASNMGLIGATGDEDIQPAIIPAPVKAEDFDTVLADAAAEVDTLGRGGGDDKGGDKGDANFTAALIPAPDITEFISGMDTASAVAAGFIETFNTAMGGGGGKKKKKSSGLIIAAPDASLFEEGLSVGIDLTNEFVGDFTSGMTDVSNSAQDSIDDIISNMQDLQASVEDAIDVIDELQNGLDNLKSKNITVHVGLSGPGVKFLATGYHGVVDKPTLMIVGEAGPERVDVSPSGGSPVTGLTMDRNVNISPVFSQSAKDLMGKDNNIMASLKEARSGFSERAIVQTIVKQINIDNKLSIDGIPILRYIKEHLLDNN
jgi:hypothetical protein